MKREINIKNLPQDLLPEIDEMFKRGSTNKGQRVQELVTRLQGLATQIPTLEAALDKMFDHLEDIKKLKSMKAVDPALIQYEENLVTNYEKFITGYLQEMKEMAKDINITEKDVLEGYVGTKDINVALKLRDYGVNVFTGKRAVERAEELMSGKYRQI